MTKVFGRILATGALFAVAACNMGSGDSKPTAETKGSAGQETKAPAPQKAATEAKYARTGQ